MLILWIGFFFEIPTASLSQGPCRVGKDDCKARVEDTSLASDRSLLVIEPAGCMKFNILPPSTRHAWNGMCADALL
jgi:hypothetical protein